MWCFAQPVLIFWGIVGCGLPFSEQFIMPYWQGDYIEDFQPLCEVQSDKATIEITSRYKGKVANILYDPGDIVKVRFEISKYWIWYIFILIHLYAGGL